MKRSMRQLAAAALAMFTLWPTRAPAQCAPDVEYRQSDAVRQRYPDPPLRFATPAFASGKSGFTTHDEMMAYLESLAGRAGNMLMRTAGHSQEGRVLPVLVFTSDGR